MLSNYWKTALRSLMHNRLFTILNVLGLATGLACSILILLWVKNEWSYDKFNKNIDHTYRITSTVIGETYPMTGAPMGEAMKAQIPGIKYAARIRGNYGSSSVFTIGSRHFEEKGAYFADPGILRIFSFPLVSGDPSTALVRPDGLLLTQRIARKYFGEKDPMGKTIRMGEKASFTITGILKDPPATSHLQFDILIPMSFDARTDDDIIHSHWDNLNFYTYIVFDDKASTTPASLAAIERQLHAISLKAEPSFEAAFHLQPLDKVHLYSRDILYDIGAQGDIAYVRLFSIVALFILLVACINFMNLATARSARRGKEVGVRKVIGASRGQLVWQFLSESLLITFASLLVAGFLVVIALPAFNRMLGKELVIDLRDGWLLVGLLLVFLLTSLVAGSYPAFFLSSFRPVQVLKAKAVRVGAGSLLFRNGLVVFQFVVSIVLIVGTVVIYRQLHFMQHKDLGFDKEHLVYIPLKGDLSRKSELLAAELSSHLHLHNYTIASDIPVNAGMGTVGVRWKDITENHRMFSIMGVDEHFLSVFKMQLVAGRALSAAFREDSMNYVVNEAALKVMGMDARSAVGEPLTVWGNKGSIVGVVKDFNFKPMQSAVDPLILRYNPGAGKEWLRKYAVVNAAPATMAETIGELKSIWTKLNPVYDFEYGFVDQQLEKQYVSQQRMGHIFNVFALLAIFISCLGLSGLAAFTAEQRTREIGVRKVLGASVGGIVAMLSKGFVRLVLISTVIACPIAYFGMHRWLQDFAYRIPLSGWIFAGAGVLALMIALLTVSFHAAKAAMVNPAKSLCTE